MKVEPVPDPAKHPVPLIESRIYLIRGQKVLLDGDLAALYQVTTSNLNKAVQRNRGRFPLDFMFQLTREEEEALRFQFGISNQGRGGRRYLPYAFTEQGIAMLSSVLRSERAIEVNIGLDYLEWRQNEQGQQIQVVFETIQHLIEAPGEEPERRRIGFPSSQVEQQATE